MSVSFKDGPYEVELDSERINNIAKRFISDILDVVEDVTKRYNLTYEAQRILVDELFMAVIAHILRFLVESNAKSALELYRLFRGLKS